MLHVQFQLPFGETLPTLRELGWNTGIPTIRVETVIRMNTASEEKDYDPDNPDNNFSDVSGWHIG